MNPLAITLHTTVCGLGLLKFPEMLIQYVWGGSQVILVTQEKNLRSPDEEVDHKEPECHLK